MLHELRLSRATHNLCDLHRRLPHGAACLFVRYTQTELIAVYKSA
jgi:hypothetical protein